MLIQEAVPTPRARVQIHVERAYDFDEKTGLFMRRQEEDDVEAFNLITDAGRVRLHTFCYDTASRTNGLNYVALSNDSGAPAAGDTALATELTADGLARAQGTVTLATGSGNQTTIQKIFTYLGHASRPEDSPLRRSRASGGRRHGARDPFHPAHALHKRHAHGDLHDYPGLIICSVKGRRRWRRRNSRTAQVRL
jgi:hypothetical protein